MIYTKTDTSGNTIFSDCRVIELNGAMISNPTAEMIAYVPPVIPLGAQDAYAKGAHVGHNDKHWESDVDNNTWEPGVYGWTEVN